MLGLGEIVEGSDTWQTGEANMRQRKSLIVERVVPEGTKAIVFRLAGKLTGTKECYEFLEDVREDVRAGHLSIVLNVEKIDQVSSPGIGIIAACYTSTTNAGGSMAVVGAPQRVRTLLEVVCLWDLLAHYDTEEQALQSAVG
jgi:anti-anti-sigma factor